MLKRYDRTLRFQGIRFIIHHGFNGVHDLSFLNRKDLSKPTHFIKLTETIRQKYDRKYKEWSEKNSTLIREKRDLARVKDKYREKKSKHDAEVKKWERDQDILNQKIDVTNRRTIEYNARYGGRMLTMSELALAKKIIADIEKDEAPFPKEKARLINEKTRLETQAEKLHSEELDIEEKTRQLNLQEELIIKEKKELDDLLKVKVEEKLSGEHWVKKFPVDTSLDALEPKFKEKVESFINALKEAKANYSIGSVYRPTERQYLMYYAHKIANGEMLPNKVPAQKGVDIQWLHSDDDTNYTKSIDAAKKMVEEYQIKGLVAPPGKSRHEAEKGKVKAIDITISWTGELTIKDKSGNTTQIKGEPKNNDNQELMDIAKTYDLIRNTARYDSGEKKGEYKDPVHWSENGK